MADEPALAVRGIGDVCDALDAVARQSEDMTEIHRRVVGRLIPDVSAATPRRTGALAASWSVGATADSGQIRSSSSYAGPVESGVPARGIPGAAMVARTIDEHAEDIARGYEDELAAAGARAGFRVTR